MSVTWEPTEQVFAVDFKTDDRYIERARRELGLPNAPAQLSTSELRSVLWTAQVYKQVDIDRANGKGIRL